MAHSESTTAGISRTYLLGAFIGINSEASESPSRLSEITGPRGNRKKSTRSRKSSKATPDFHSIGLYGRDGELATLMEAFERVKCANEGEGFSEFFFVNGQSGTGKSSLVQKMIPGVSERGGYFISGKFDQFRKNEPFSAIVCAFTDLCDIIQTEEASMNEILGREDAQKLKNLVYNLYGVEDTPGIGGHKANGQEGRATAASLARASLKECCCKFLRNVATVEHPIVLFLDDVQWVDESSAELIQAIVNDTASRNQLLICSVRCEKEADHELLPFTLDEASIPVSSINVSNLDQDCLNKMVSDLLGINETETLPLSKAVIQKTHGNPYFARQFLEKLFSDGFISRESPDLDSSPWQWDISKVQAETNISDNVVEIMNSKIKKLPKDMKCILQLAACLGFEFDVKLLYLLVVAEAKVQTIVDIICPTKVFSEAQLKEILQAAEEAGMVDKKTDARYKFSHDRVQQCLCDMLPHGYERDRFHMRNGKLIWELCKTHERQDWLVFAAADQMNRCDTKSSTDEKIEVATVNLEAATLSRMKSAFDSALAFLRIGVDLLGSEWSDVYELRLEIWTMLAEIECGVGNLSESKKLVNETIANARNLWDKMRAYYTMIDCLGTEGHLQEAVDVGFSTLSQLGFHLPTKASNLRVFRELMKTRRLLKGMTDADILSLPKVSDEKKLAPLYLLGLISTYAPFLVDQQKPMLLLNLRLLQYSLTNGISWLAPQSFAFYGIVQGSLGDTEAAYRFGHLSLCLAERIGSRAGSARALCPVHSSLFHWKNHARDSLEPLLSNVDDARATGEVKAAFFSLFSYLNLAFYCGEPLDALEERLHECCEDVAYYHDTALIKLVRLLWQTVLNLQESDNPTDLTGEAMNEKNFVGEAMATKNFGVMIQMWLMKIVLAYHFGDLGVAERALKNLESREHLFRFHTSIYVHHLYGGLIHFGRAQATKKRVYRMRARRHTKRLEKMMARGNVNCRPLVKILHAEQKMTHHQVGKSNDRARIAYNEAIKAIRMANLPHLEALANERAWLACSERDIAQKPYLSKAIQLYSRWGARSIVRSLQDRALSVEATEKSGRSSKPIIQYYEHVNTPALPPW